MRKFLPAAAAALLVVTLTALGVHWLEMELAISGASEVILAVPAIWAVLLVAGLSVLVARWTGIRLLTPQQVLLAAFAASMAAPLLTQGFWHRMFGAVTTVPREGQLATLSALSDRLWPHGPDLARGWLSGPTVIDAAHPQRFALPTLIAGEPLLGIALVRATELPTGSALRFAVHADDANDGGGAEAEFALLDRPTRADPLRQDGFESIGAYGIATPTSVSGRWQLELSLSGPGSVTVQQVRLLSVAAIESALSGVRTSETGLTTAQQVVPWAAWRDPLIAWGCFLGLLFAATYAVNAVMRKQWVDAERFPLPVARAWSMLVGAEEERSPLWRSSWLWVTAAVACGWGLLRWAHQVDPSFPNLAIQILPSDYIRDPSWGSMWDITFSVSAMAVGIALFFEVGLLGSMLVGFALFRYMYCLGERTGLGSDPAYPWRYEQQVGAYVAYGLIILITARRHLVTVCGQVLRGGWKPVDDEALSARVAMLLLLASVVGTVGWASWTGVGLLGTSMLMGFLLLVGVVASRLRAQSGLLFSMFAPYSAGTVLLALGGIGAFGANAVLLAFIASFFLAANTFFIPGAQLELMQHAKRERLGGWSTATITVIGIGGGLIIGGWVFLTTIYGIGADHLPYQWAFDTKPWYFGTYNTAVVTANGGGHGQVAWTGYLVGLIGTGFVAGLRLVWSGFAMQPAGMLFGPSYMMEMFWGSALVAFVLRWTAVRAGGAEVVRTRLLPAAIGLILGSCIAYLIIALHTAALLHAGKVAPSIGNTIL